MGISTARQNQQDDSSYHCQTTGGLEFKRAMERSHHSDRSSQAKPSLRKNDHPSENKDEERVTSLTLRTR